MKKTKLGDRIKQARKHFKMTEKSLAEKIGITQQAIHVIERDNIKSKYLVEIADVLDVSINWLLFGGQSLQDEIESRNKRIAQKISIIGKWCDMKNIDKAIEKSVMKHVVDIEDNVDFALYVQDNSMTSSNPGVSFPEKSLIFIKRNVEIKSGDYVIAWIDNDETPIFRQYIESGKKYLVPLNNSFPTLQIDDNEVLFLGVVTKMSINIKN